MPQATPIHSPRRPPLAIATGADMQPNAAPPAPKTDEERPLTYACRRATHFQVTIAALADSVATFSLSDPRHDAAHAAIAGLRPEWRDWVDQAAGMHAVGAAGLRWKAKLLDLLTYRDGGDVVQTSSAIACLAASLATDIIRGRWSPSG